MKSFRKTASALVCAAFLLHALPPAPARAGDAETPPPPPPPPPPLRVYQLSDTIDVAGRRLPLDPLRVPMATTTVRGASLLFKRQTGLDEALDLVPGVVAHSRSGAGDVRITMRGFGARGAGERSNAGTTRGIRILLDGFPLTEPDGRTSLDLADLAGLARIDVVRSNTSALFGSASGGLVNLVSNAAFSRPFFDVRTAGGSFGYRRTQASAGVLAGGARLHLTVTRTLFDGWRRHSEADAATIEASVLSDPSPRSSLGLFLAATRSRFQQPGALTWEEFRTDPRQADPRFVARNDRRDNRIGRVGVRWQQELAGEQHLLVSGYVEPKTLDRSERNRYRDFQRIHSGGTVLYSRAFKAAGVARARWSAGLDEAFQDGSILFYDLDPGGARGTNLVADKREGNNNLGFYTELAAERGRWEATAGARYDLVRYIFEDHQHPALDDARTLKQASPRFALAYRYRENHSFYAALSGGIEAPAFNEVDPPAPFDTLTGLNPFLKPASSLTYEVGAKGRLMMGAGRGQGFQYDVTAYRIELSNDIVPWDGGAYYFTAGRSRRTGLEIGLGYEPDRGLGGRIAGAFSKNEYLRYTNDLGDFGGNEAAGIPPLTATAMLRYRAPFGLAVEGILRTVGRYYADDANTARVPAYTVADVTVSSAVRLWRVRMELFGGIRNLADERYVSSVFINGVDGRYYEPGMERNAHMGIRIGGERSE